MNNYEKELARIELIVPVYEVTFKGMSYYVGEKVKDWGCLTTNNYTIYIYKRLPNYRKLWILLHEYGHYLCCSRKCGCPNNNVLCESHAHIYALDYCKKHGYLSARGDLINYLNRYRDAGGHHYAIYKKVRVAHPIKLYQK